MFVDFFKHFETAARCVSHMRPRTKRRDWKEAWPLRVSNDTFRNIKKYKKRDTYLDTQHMCSHINALIETRASVISLRKSPFDWLNGTARNSSSSFRSLKFHSPQTACLRSARRARAGGCIPRVSLLPRPVFKPESPRTSFLRIYHGPGRFLARLCRLSPRLLCPSLSYSSPETRNGTDVGASEMTGG